MMKVSSLLEGMDPLFPADFFSWTVEVGTKMTAMPDLSAFLEEEKFGALSLSWSEDGVYGSTLIKSPFAGSFFPDYSKGDAVELFFDTRDNKKASCPSRFCHHFVFLPGEVNGVLAQEVTRFRQEEQRPLAEASLLKQEMIATKEGYSFTFTLPKEVLYGYDPLQFSRMGFAYRLHRYRGKPQHFPVSSKCFDLWQHPQLWASLVFKK